MTVDARTLARPRGSSLRLLPCLLIAAVATTFALLLFGGSSLVRLITVGVVGLGVLIAIVARRPVLSVAWLPVLVVPDQFLKVYAYEVVLLAATAFLVFWAWVRREPWLGRLHGLEIVVWLFWAWAVFTFVWVFDSWWWLFGVRKILIGCIGLWLAWRLPRLMDANLLFVGIAAGTVGVALATLARAYSVGWFSSVHQGHMRRTATTLGWGNSNYIAALLVMLLPTCIYLAMNAKSWNVRILGIAAAPLTAMVTTVAASRGGSLLTLAIALFMVFRSRVRPWVPIAIAPVLLALLLLGPGAQLLLARFSDPKDFLSIVVRFAYFREGWRRTVDHWPLGMGLGQGYNYLDRLHHEDPHNYWLVLGSELGLVGLVLFIAIMVVIYRRILKMCRTPETRAAGQALQLTFWIVHANTMFEPTFQGLQIHFLWYWVMGVYFGWYDQVTGKIPMPAAQAATPARPG